MLSLLCSSCTNPGVPTDQTNPNICPLWLGVCFSCWTWIEYSTPTAGDSASPKTHSLRVWRGSFPKGGAYLPEGGSRCQSVQNSNCLLQCLSKLCWMDMSWIVNEKIMILWRKESAWMNSLGIDSLLLAFSSTLARAYYFFSRTGSSSVIGFYHPYCREMTSGK